MSDPHPVALASLIEARIAKLVERLGLPAGAGDLIFSVALAATDAEEIAAIAEVDPHARAGIAPWSWLAGGLDDVDAVYAMERAATALHAWGVVQIVGLEPGDPVVPGDAPLRLTGLGRAMIGLAPSARRATAPADPSPWTVLHGASRERLLLEAGSTGGGIVTLADPLPPPLYLAGRVGLSLCEDGRVVLDATLLPEMAVAAGISELIRRTPRAAGERLILVLDPTPLRSAALDTGASLRWVAPTRGPRRGAHLQDMQVEQALEQAGLGVGPADRAGVPDNELAAPLPSEVRWEDVILAPNVQFQLDQALAHARHRLRLGPSGPGYRLLLSGPPGTGKSTIGNALADALGAPVMRLDLSTVLSRWFGETERTLAQVFDLAESAGAVLILDEAESLLRQREQRGAGEAMATAVSYLLTRMERYRSVLVGTSNRIQDFDEAFFRRFDDLIVIPIPDAAARQRHWRRNLPADAELQWELLADRVPVAGALIAAAARRALAWAEAAGVPATMPVVLASLARELEKSNRSPGVVLIDPWRDEVSRLLGGG